MEAGSGERTLVFIHGLANYAPVWVRNIEYLRQYCRCIAIDLPGNGLSDKNEHKFSMAFFAESVANFIAALDLKNVCIVGHSMGGQVAITTLLKYPGCANALILCAPAGFEKFTAIEKSMYKNMMHLIEFVTTDELSLRKTIETSFFKPQPQVDKIVKELVAIMKTYKGNYYKKMVEACIMSMLEDSVHDRLPQLLTPTFVIFGSKDALIPNKLIHHITTEKLALEAVKLIPGGQLKMIPDCGHFVQWEKADEVNKTIKEYLQHN